MEPVQCLMSKEQAIKVVFEAIVNKKFNALELAQAIHTLVGLFLQQNGLDQEIANKRDLILFILRLLFKLN